MEELDNSNYNISHEEFDNLGEKFKVITEYLNNDDNAARKLLLSLEEEDLANYLDDSNDEVRSKVFELLGVDLSPEVLIWLDDNVRQRVYNILGYERVASLISMLASEDAIAAIEDLDEITRYTIIDRLPTSQQNQVKEGLQYPEDSAGRIMERNFVSLHDYWNVENAIDALRKKKKSEAEELIFGIVTDSEKKPKGIVLLSRLLHYSDNTPIQDIMDNDIKVANVLVDQQEISYAFKQYSLDIVPITNSRGKLVGIVSINKMFHIMDKQSEEEFLHLSGINARDLYQTYLLTAKLRFPWLFVNLVTASITAIITSLFEVTISKMITIAAVMPVLIAISSNVGTQTCTVVVRSLSSREINDNNYYRVVWKETMVSFMNSIGIALAGSILLYVIFFNVTLSIVFAVASVISFVTAGFLGALIPIFLSKMDLDPAISSSILLTAMTDAIGVFSFLCLAYLMI